MATGADQVLALSIESINRSLVCGAVDTDIRNIGVPRAQLLLEIHNIDEYPAGQEVTFNELRPGLNFTFGAGPVGLTHPRFKSPMLGKGAKRAVPTEPDTLSTGMTHGASPIIQMLEGVAAEMLERSLVRFQKRTP